MSNNTPANVPTKPYKAIVGLVLALVLALIAAYMGDDKLTVDEVLTCIAGALVTAGGIYGVRNPAA